MFQIFNIYKIKIHPINLSDINDINDTKYHEIEINIRNLRYLSNDDFLFLEKISKNKLIRLINIYNDIIILFDYLKLYDII